MSALVCAMSGDPPVKPVVSRKSGHIFEHAVIAKYLLETGRCPITGQELAAADLIDLKANPEVKPKPVSATSLPGMIGAFQTEWDASVIETHMLRKELEQVRNELAHTLYQHDAACRVIAKLIQERDAAVAVANDPARRAAPAGDAMEEDGIPEVVKERMTERSQELSKGRKKRPVSELLAGEAAIQATKFAAHQKKAATSVAVHPKNESLVLSADTSGAAVICDRATGKAAVPIVGHKASITHAIFHPTQDVIFTASKDSTVKMWSAQGKQIHSFGMHKGEVSGVSVHATGDYIVSTSTDKSWAFCDIEQGKCLQLVQGDISGGFSASMVHPDGLILGSGTTDGMVRIWDIKSQQNVVSFTGHGGAIGSLCFSENGYYCATTSSDGCKVKTLDPR
ncbi:WD40-repeat-containing domain protein [Baffinella frigidus]|nr:WD40-repeat-containing domain protein [Cryptophyta sp. CCMP2293]